MSKDQLKELLVHPYFISLILWAIIIIIIPTNFLKFQIRHISDEFTPKNVRYIYSDLDDDEISERISVDLTDLKQTKIIVYEGNKLVNEYDLSHQSDASNPLFFGDYNGDDFKECFVFTIGTDSIFLNIVDPIKTRKMLLMNRFVDFWTEAKSSTDRPVIIPIGLVNNDRNTSKDFVFYINTGFSKYPRRVYRYLIEQDSLVKSPESNAVIDGFTICDINYDSSEEIILNVCSTGNFKQDTQYSDSLCWLMVLDRDLHWPFPPVKFREKPSRLVVIPFKTGNKVDLLLFHDYYGIGELNSCFYIFDSQGNKLSEKPISDYQSEFSNIFMNSDSAKRSFYFLKNRNTDIQLIDSDFKLLKTVTIPPVESVIPLEYLDADLDGRKEYLFQGRANRSVIFVAENFECPVEYQYNGEPGRPLISQVLNRHKDPQLYLQFEGYGSYICYKKNPLYYLKYLLYGSFYIAVLLFITITFRIHQYRLKLKTETEKKIATLQMKAIRNQLDPHFSMNILNTIGSLYATETDKNKADYIFGKYAKLIRQTVISSDQIIIPLVDEIDFIRNYIELERFRFNNSFNYSIEIENNVNLQALIPRMLIHTFVENSIKYGVRKKSEGGQLKITVQSINSLIRVIIEDNGPGLQSDNSSPHGTHKGLKILNELIELYNKLEKKRVTYTLQNTFVEGNFVSGVKAIINIPS